MWFRIIQMDGYLSLMLGLSPGTLDTNFANAKTLEACNPMERLERMECLAGRRIIQRSTEEIHDMKNTREIDRLLQDAASTMPPQWWLAPDLSSKVGHELGTLQDTIRLMSQFTHYHLLERLHLPYLLHHSTDPQYDYSKITAVMASRELLSRFLPFRSSEHLSSFCRGIDFLAFIASTALCLAHIVAQRQNQVRDGEASNENGALLSFLLHQRISDRGMIERMHEIMEQVSRTTDDKVAAKISNVMGHLLDIEAHSATGASYETDSSYGGDEDDLECNGRVSQGGTVLRIYIPHFGTIMIERHNVSKSGMVVPSPGFGSSVMASVTDPVVMLSSPLPSEAHTEHDQGLESSRSCPTDFTDAIPSAYRPVENESVVSSGGPATWNAPEEIPGMDWIDESDLQGVDIAFFDSLFPS
jgi:hypothetical protein